MIKFSEALKCIENHLKDYDVAVLLEETIETEDYWVFFYNNVKFLETGNFSYSLIGNASLIIDKYQGRIHVTGTVNSVEFYMEQFEREMLPKIKSES
jgi:hypothetical protein